MMTTTFLPPGLIGLVLAGIFSHTMAMVSSDANAISAVITRDMIPAMSAAAAAWSDGAGPAAPRASRP